MTADNDIQPRSETSPRRSLLGRCASSAGHALVSPFRLLAIIFCLAAILVLIVEALRTNAPAEAFRWVREDVTPFALSVALVATVLGAVVGLFGRVYSGLLWGSGLVLTFGITSHVKRNLLGRDLYPWDLFLHREVGNLLPHVWNQAKPFALATAVVFLISAVWMFGTVRSPRLGIAVRALLVFLPFHFIEAASPRPIRLVSSYGIKHIEWDQNVNYDKNGLLLAFTLNMGSLAVEKPTSYSPEVVGEALGSKEVAASPEPGSVQPNVIIIMSESFFDPTTLPAVTYNEDPLPNLHRLMAEHPSGTLVPPVFGGGTSNTEFELLTGHSIRFLPPGALPYQQYLKRSHPSLASHLAGLGYHARAVHPYHGWFWERTTVYPNLGFEQFISIENMPDAQYAGTYVSDAEVTSQVLQALDEREDNRPLFLFAVTMEGHGPYEEDRYPDGAITLSSDKLTEAQRRTLQSYVNGTHNADRELGLLIEALEERDEPSVVVFFGDHQPLLLPIFEKLGAINSSARPDSEDLKTLHRVPLLVWTNLGAPHEDLGFISPSFVGPKVLSLAGLPGTPYTDFLAEVAQRVPVYTPHLIYSDDGSIQKHPPDSIVPILERWKVLQYDLLFGERFQLSPVIARTH